MKKIKKPRLTPIIFVLAFAAMGTYLLIHSFAATNPNLLGDVNNDNVVNSADLNILTSHYDSSDTTADLNNDGKTSVLDLSVMLAHFGQTYSGGGGGGGGGSPTCTKVINNTGGYNNDDLENDIMNAAAGSVLCLAPNNTFNLDLNIRSSHGTAAAPITVTSQDRTRPATLTDRIITYTGGDHITFSYLNLVGSDYTRNTGSIIIGSQYVTFSHDDITNNHHDICVNLINSDTYGVARYNTFDANRIHDCGLLPSRNTDHGIYDTGFYTTITNNFIYDNTDRGIQLRGADNDTIHNNVIDGNGEGIIFSSDDDDIPASYDQVYNNIFSNSNIRYNIESYWLGPGPGNVLRDSCVYTTRNDYNENGGIDPGLGFSYTNIKNTNPLFTNRAAKDFTLQSGSPCAGFGVTPGVSPGIN